MPHSDSRSVAEFPRQLSFRALLLGVVLSMVLAGANAYLGLFAGMTVSASIPAAVISMAVLRWLRDVHVLEHNIVQTAASAGEAIAAGAIFTLPALIIMNHWVDFSAPPVMLICGVGGLLGVIFTIPLRRALIVEQNLPFPEGAATAVVLQAGESRGGIRVLAIGALLGGIAKLAETGLRLWPSAIGKAFVPAGQGVIYLGSSLSPALLAVGVIVGLNVGLLIFAGGLISWVIAIPLYANFSGAQYEASGAELAHALWSTRIRYMGVGAMLVGGLWALWSMRGSLVAAVRQVSEGAGFAAREDLPRSGLLVLLAVLVLPMFLYYRSLVGGAFALPVTAVMVLAAFLFSAVAAYMAGLVGSSNNPISGVTIATILLTALGLNALSGVAATGPVTAVMLGAVVCCAAAIGGDTLQDLKAGAVLRASPWRQQLAQMLGVVSAVLVLAPILSLLLRAYGFGAATPEHPHPLPAPQAHLMAAVAQGVFGGQLPWIMIWIGALVGTVVIGFDEYLRRSGHGFRAPVLAVAVGIYLPLELSAPIALGGTLAWLIGQPRGARDKPMLAAAGLITGEALMGIGLAVPIVLSGNGEVIALGVTPLGAWPGVALLLGLFVWIRALRAR